MKKTLLLAVVSWLAFASCKKEIRSLPEETQTGTGSFGAKVDGENWGPLKFGIVPTAPILEARFSGDNSIYINARNFSRSPVETEMEIYLYNIKTAGTVLFNKDAAYGSTGTSYAYYIKRNLNPIDEWITGSAAGGQANITKLDIANRIISGTFSFTANAKYGSAPITVTEGRFDVKIQ